MIKQKRFLIIGSCILLLMVGFLFFKRTKQKQTHTVTSSDGAAVLTLSPDSLPQGVDLNALRITTASFDTDTNAHMYILEPDGLVLGKPAQIEISLATTDSDTDIPLLVHRSDTKVFPLDDVSVVRNTKEKKAIITAHLSHFSSVTVLRDMLRVSVNAPGGVLTEEPFNVTGVVEKLAKPQTILEGGTKVVYSIADPWTIEGQMMVNKSSAEFIQPQGRENVPAFTTVHGQNKVSAPAQFTCVAPTEIIFFDYQIRISGQTKTQFVYSLEEAKRIGSEGFSDTITFSQTIRLISDIFDCVAKVKPTPTPAAVYTTPPKSETGGSGSKVSLDVLILDGKLFPANQFEQKGADTGCSSSHYHAAYEVSSVNLDTHRTDPNPAGCGFGTVDSVPRRIEQVPKEQAELF